MKGNNGYSESFCVILSIKLCTYFIYSLVAPSSESSTLAKANISSIGPRVSKFMSQPEFRNMEYSTVTHAYNITWLNDTHGIGTLKTIRFKYEGSFKHGVPHGYGTQTFYPEYAIPGSVYQYEGGFKDGQYDGSGIASYFANTSDISVVNYIGGWKNGQWEGCGTTTWPNGCQYYGGFKGGIKHGYGVSTGMYSGRYEGGFNNGTHQGYGSNAYPDGNTYQGGINEGIPHGYGIRRELNGRSYEGVFNRGIHQGYW